MVRQIHPPVFATRGRYSVELPGPSRKREPGEYSYRLIYRANDPEVDGCLAVWEVSGGRDVYQVALEQVAGGWRKWHCTCADAVYRAESQGRVCKHVIGLLAFGPLMDEPGSIQTTALGVHESR